MFKPSQYLGPYYILCFDLLLYLAPTFSLLASLHHPLRHHGVGYFHEAGDIGSFHVVDVFSVFAMRHALLVNIAHDLVQPLVHLLVTPRYMHRVLRHLQARTGYAARVDRLTRAKKHPVL